MSSLSQIQREQQTAKEALDRGEITKEQYAQFMVYSNAQRQQAVNQTKSSSTSVRAPPAVEGNWQPVNPEQPKTPVQVEQQQKAEAVQFYMNAGKPELAEKYNAPDIPGGQKVVSVTEVVPAPLGGVAAVKGDWVSKSTGEPVESKLPYVQVVTAPKEQTKSLGEQIASINPFEAGLNAAEAITGRKLSPNQRTQIMELFAPLQDVSGVPGVKGTPTEFLGGAVSSVEAPIYAAATAWGVQGLPQPKTVSSALIGTVLAGQITEEFASLNTGSQAYVAGSITGELLLFAGTAKGAQLIFKGATRLAPVLASAGVKGTVARAGLSAGLGALFGGVMSGGDTDAIVQGALIGAGASVAVELGVKGYNALRSRLPKRLGGVERLQEGPLVEGKSGEQVKTYVSENPVEGLGGRKLEVVADVTKNPASYSELADEYVGKNIPTGHTTLGGEKFNLGKGGETLLKGFPGEAAGGRELGFYSAPGSKGKVTLYGGYIGVGEGYSEQAKIVFGGKQSALVTLGTEVAPEYLPGVSGLTAIPPENVAGASLERQVATTTAYKNYPGTVFRTEGKVGVFQVQQKPAGLLGRIPILGDLFSSYSNITVYKGAYVPVSGAPRAVRGLNLNAYNSSYVRVVSLPSFAAVPAVAPIVVRSTPKAPSSQNVTVKSNAFIPSSPNTTLSKVTSNLSSPSIPSVPSTPSSFRSYPQVSPKTYPSLPTPSAPKSVFNIPSAKSTPSVPSEPYVEPSLPRSPSITTTFPSSPKSLNLAYPSSIDWPKGTGVLDEKLFGTKLKVWRFPVLDPGDVLSLRVRRKRKR